MTTSLRQLSEMVRKRKITATSLIEEACDNAVAHSDLDAFICLDRHGALQKAQRIDNELKESSNNWPLAGIPIVVKDNINVRGFQTTAGTPGMNFQAKTSAPIIESLEKAGAIVIGKTNLHELAFGVTSNNAAYGAVRNPWDKSCFPGGSSGGTAVAIAAGIVSAGLGTDTAGSIRLPAALTGIVGFRPSTGCLSTEGIVPSVPAFDTSGPMAANVEDTAYLFEILTGSALPQAKPLNQLRLGLAHPLFNNLSPGVYQAFKAALHSLSSAGTTLIEIDLSSLVSAVLDVGFPIGFHQMKTAMTQFLASYQPNTQLAELVAMIKSNDVKAVYQESVLGPKAPSNADYQTALKKMPGVRDNYLKIIQQHQLDAIVFPTAPIEAQSISTSSNQLELNGKILPTLDTLIHNNATAAVTGAPGISIPIGRGNNGLPVGLELDGVPGADLTLLAIAKEIELQIPPLVSNGLK
ncbi:amidase family protein [Microbulbifer sp. JMSA002]|uniref:amidase family protein n=1 Tax=Microbulbifer sp. JMSA002 TaxID=3243368 RepID=UPI0040392F95